MDIWHFDADAMSRQLDGEIADHDSKEKSGSDAVDPVVIVEESSLEQMEFIEDEASRDNRPDGVEELILEQAESIEDSEASRDNGPADVGPVPMDYEQAQIHLNDPDQTSDIDRHLGNSHPQLMNEGELLRHGEEPEKAPDAKGLRDLHESHEERIPATRTPFQEIASRSGKENVSSSVAKEENDHKISQLGAEMQEMRQLVESLNKKRAEDEETRKLSENRVRELQVEVEAAESVVQKVTADLQSQREAFEEQHVTLNDVMKKLDVQSLFLDSGSAEANKAKDCIELESRCRALTQKLADKDNMLRCMREDFEKSRIASKKKEQNFQQEKEEIIVALEASEVKSQEQGVKLLELETNLGRAKGQTANLEKRCKTAEAKAAESLTLVVDLQSKLDTTTMELFQLKDSSSQHDLMKLRLQECERALNLATTQKALAEDSLRNLRAREEHIEEVEKGNRDLEERLKWRNEQFGSLEEAHSKARLEFKEQRSVWDGERAGLLSEVDSLQDTLDSKERILHDMQDQLEMVHHALSHEESRRKILELQASEWREGLEKATAGCEAAQTSMELLREQTSTEIGTLRNVLGEKDRQLNDSKVKYTQMAQEYTDLKKMENEFLAWQSGNGEQQQKLRSLEDRMASMVEAHENLRLRMREQEKGFEQESRNLLHDLGVTNDSLASTDEALKQRDIELDTIKRAFDVVKSQRSGLDARLNDCEKQLEEARGSAADSRAALASLEIRSQAEAMSLKESLQGKEKVIQDLKAKIALMDQSISALSMREETWVQMEKEYESLRQQQIEKETQQRELVKVHELSLERSKEEKASWVGDKDRLVKELELRQEALNEAEKKLEEVHWIDDRHRDAIRKLEGRCEAHEKEMAVQLHLVGQAREQLEEEKMETEKLRKEANSVKESFSAAMSHKDLMNQQLTVQIGGLEAEILLKDKEVGSLHNKISISERKLQESLDSRVNMQEHIEAMKSESGKMTEEIRLLEDVRNGLEVALRALRKEHEDTKKDLEGKLEMAYKDLSVSSHQLKAASERLEEETSQKEALLKDLDVKEAVLSESMEAKRVLAAEKESLREIARSLEAKKSELLQEIENGRITTNQLCDKYEAAQANFESSCREAKELRALLQNAHKVSEKLLKAEEQKKELEGYLQAAKGIALEKEEKLAASEWAIQQLARDIGKSKSALSAKEREEATLRFQLEDVERQLSEKEGILIEMECYLHEAVIGKETLQGVVDKLHQEMEDLSRGAAERKKKEQEMASQLEKLGAALEEKRDELDATLVKLKRSDDQREFMGGAIESLKRNLADGKEELSLQQNESSKLCDHLERCQSEANASAERVKELHGRLQQLEQSSDDHIKRFQLTLSELNDELSLSYTQLEKSQNSIKSLTEESSRFREKCEALSDLNSSQYSSLKDMEAELSRVQAVALDQSTMLENRDRELQRATERLQQQDVRMLGLEDSLSKVQSQRSDLQVENIELIDKLRKLTDQYDVLSNDLALKSKELDGMKLQLEQLKTLLVQEGEAETLIAKISEELQASCRIAQDREVRIGALQSSLDGAHVELKVLQDSVALRDIDNDLLLQKLSAAEKQCEDTQVELSQLQEGLALADAAIAENSAVLSSYVDAMGAMETEKEEWRAKAESSSTAVTSLSQQLHDASRSALISQEKLSITEVKLEDLQKEFDESREKLQLQVIELQALGGEVKAWKDSSVAASEDKLVLHAALAKAEVTVQEKDVAIESLREALTIAESGISSSGLVASQLQTELALLRGREAAAEEERGALIKQLEATRGKAESHQQEIVKLQATLQNSLHELEDKTQQILTLVSTIANLQEELVGWNAKVAGTENEVALLNMQLQEEKAKGLHIQEEALQSQGALTRMEQVLAEERRNFERLTTLEGILRAEETKAVESASSIHQLESKLEESKRKADNASSEVDALKEQLWHLKEAKMEVEQALLEEKTSMQHLATVERSLESERMKTADLDRLVAELNDTMTKWKARMEDAEAKASTINQELNDALGKVNSLILQLQSHQEKEQSLQELNGATQAKLDAAQEELLARKEKMAAILHDLEQSQHSAKELLQGLEMEKIVAELDKDEESEEEKACDLVQFQWHIPNVSPNGRASKSPLEGDEIKEHLLEESQASQNCTQARVGEGFEKEMDAFRLRSEEAQLEAQQLAEKLEAALSTVAAKNLIIKQVTDEIGGLRSQVKALEEDVVRKLAQGISETDGPECEFHECSNLASEVEDAGFGKRKADRQEELNQYLELCDSLVRKNIRLEKQLDGLQRRNRGLQKQLQGLQTEKTATDKERRALDPVDCSLEHGSQWPSRKSNPNAFKSSTGQDISKAGNVLGEIDENAAPVNFERSQMSRRPPISPAASIQSKKARRIKDEC